jgi:hypothetical protein
MVGWIIVAAVALVALLLWKGLRTMWSESTAQVDALPPANERRTWPLPTTTGDRIMWCPILAKKVVLADTKADEGEIGTVVGFSGDNRPQISFDARPDQPPVIDKWGAARVLPAAAARPKRSAPPSARAQASNRRKKRRR